MNITPSNCRHIDAWSDGEAIELVYFCFPGCDGHCRHCWSSGSFLGRCVRADWHEDFWRQVDSSRLSAVKISGGETFLYFDLLRLVRLIRHHLGESIVIKLLTSGRPFVSLRQGETGIAETLSAMRAMELPWRNLEIHMSADEHHAESWLNIHAKQTISSTPVSAESLLVTATRNFLGACARLKAHEPSFSGRLKIHTGTNRLAWHRQVLFPHISDAEWDAVVDSSEGLIDSGRAAENGIGDFSLHSGTSRSIFILPGASFGGRPTSRHSQEYSGCSNGHGAFLNPSHRDGDGACVLGWWNLVNKRFCGGAASDALRLIGKAPP